MLALSPIQSGVGAPSCLQRELGWLLEDTIGAERRTAATPWSETTWRSTELSYGGAAVVAATEERLLEAQLLLRIPLAQLQVSDQPDDSIEKCRK